MEESDRCTVNESFFLNRERKKHSLLSESERIMNRLRATLTWHRRFSKSNVFFFLQRYDNIDIRYCILYIINDKLTLTFHSLIGYQ